MPKRGNKDTRAWKLRGTREADEKDYFVRADPDIRGVDKGRREAERYRDSRREERR